MTDIDTLIVVCCHAVYVGGSHGDGGPVGSQESDWLIEPFQSGETPTFISHIQAGVEQLSRRPNAILAFSGGATKPQSSSKTEAKGYWDVAVGQHMFGLGKTESMEGQQGDFSGLEDLLTRTFTDDWSADSYQNILLSLVQYEIWRREHDVRSQVDYSKISSVAEWEELANMLSQEYCASSRQTLHLPKTLIVVGHEFKRSRFLELHLPAIQKLWEDVVGGSTWTIESVEYIGIDPPFDEVKLAEVTEGDKLRGFGAWKDDLHGKGELLAEKRTARGWDSEKFLIEVKKWFDEDSSRFVKAMI